jgi:hypothetical protein
MKDSFNILITNYNVVWPKEIQNDTLNIDQHEAHLNGVWNLIFLKVEYNISDHNYLKVIIFWLENGKI